MPPFRNQEIAPVVIFGGPIRTMDDSCPVVEAIGLEAGLVRAVGSRADVTSALARENGGRPRLFDLKGATLLPGFVDSHVHLGSFASRMAEVDLDGLRTLDEVLMAVARFARTVPAGRWVRGGGFNKNLWGDGRFPSRTDLDRVVPDKPVGLSSKDGHTTWLNSEALRRLGLTRDTPDPPGGEIERDPSGEPTGILKENAGSLFWSAIPEPTAEEAARSLLGAVEVANKLGLVGVSNMEGRESFRALQSLDASGQLTLRVWQYLPIEELPSLRALGLASGFGGGCLRLGGVKAFLDGALGSQTADMLDPFEGTASHGKRTLEPGVFAELVEQATALGLAVAVHAIGDRANRTALDAFEKHQEAWHAAGLRHRIEHAQLVDLSDQGRFGKLGVIASMQPLHAPSDRDIADRHWGPRRSAYGYAWRSIAASGATLAFGSDVPVEVCDPLQGLFAATTRRHPKDPDRAPWHPEETVSMLDAVRAYTSGAARAVRAEEARGILRPGFAADCTIISNDILAPGFDPRRLLETEVVATVVGGRFVFGG